jgi:hypothetical protein
MRPLLDSSLQLLGELLQPSSSACCRSAIFQTTSMIWVSWRTSVSVYGSALLATPTTATI